jgi:hypothetical protein
MHLITIDLNYTTIHDVQLNHSNQHPPPVTAADENLVISIRGYYPPTLNGRHGGILPWRHYTGSPLFSRNVADHNFNDVKT